MKRTLILFVLGAALLLPFDSTIPLTAGILLLVASIVSGVFAVATPAFLSGDEPPSG
jgi:hypothetical protein